MRRLVAAVAMIAVLSLSGPPASVHVHGHADHDHGAHQHGPAAHTHARIAHRHHGGEAGPTASFEACSPDAHVLAAGGACVTVAPHVAPAAVPSWTAVMAPPGAPWRASPPQDVRAHGPPWPANAALRAPPLVAPA